MTRGRAESRSQERIRHLVVDSRLDHQALRRAVLAEVARTVPFDAYVWPLCDPRSTVAMAPQARIPCPQELPRLVRLKYLSRPARWTVLMGSASPAVTLLQATEGELARSPVWNGVMQRYGVRDVLSTVFSDKYGCWAWLDLWRTGDSRAFSDQEASYLAALAEVVAAALRRAVAREFRANAAPGTASFGNGSVRNGEHPLPAQAVLTLDDDLRIAGQTASVDDWLRLLQPGPSPHHHVPAEVLNVAAQLLAREAGVDSHEAEGRVNIGAGRWATLRATRMATGAPDSAGPPLAVTIQGCSASSRLDMFARAFGLTPRQGELLRLASTGADTGTMAEAQGVSQYTVQDQFKHVFQTCGVHSRPSRLAMALGNGI